MAIVPPSWNELSSFLELSKIFVTISRPVTAFLRCFTGLPAITCIRRFHDSENSQSLFRWSRWSNIGKFPGNESRTSIFVCVHLWLNVLWFAKNMNLPSMWWMIIWFQPNSSAAEKCYILATDWSVGSRCHLSTICAMPSMSVIYVNCRTASNHSHPHIDFVASNLIIAIVTPILVINAQLIHSVFPLAFARLKYIYSLNCMYNNSVVDYCSIIQWSSDISYRSWWTFSNNFTSTLSVNSTIRAEKCVDIVEIRDLCPVYPCCRIPCAFNRIV